MIRHQRGPTLFPYTTLFRSAETKCLEKRMAAYAWTQPLLILYVDRDAPLNPCGRPRLRYCKISFQKVSKNQYRASADKNDTYANPNDRYRNRCSTSTRTRTDGRDCKAA